MKQPLPVNKPATLSSLNQLLEKVEFSPENIVEAAASNSVLFLKAAEHHMTCWRKKTEAKMAWESTRALQELELRQEARKNGERITEGNIEAKLLTHPGVVVLARALNAAEEQAEYSKLVVEAFRMRRDCLRIIGDLVRDEMSLQRAVEGNTSRLRDIRRKAQARFPGTEGD